MPRVMQQYQKFEYAIGHWLQKATEHMLGCVLCRYIMILTIEFITSRSSHIDMLSLNHNCQVGKLVFVDICLYFYFLLSLTQSFKGGQCPLNHKGKRLSAKKKHLLEKHCRHF